MSEIKNQNNSSEGEPKSFSSVAEGKSLNFNLSETPALPPGRPIEKEKFFSWRFLLELAVTIVISWTFVSGVKAFAFQPFIVDGISMEPNFHNSEYLIVNEFKYRMEEPKRGDVVVFKYPYDQDKFYIKRIVCLPGETCRIQDGKVQLCKEPSAEDCQYIEEIYLEMGMDTKNNQVVTLGSDEYFVLGDNRDFSYDSRAWGPLKKEFIIGRVWLRAWPVNKITSF